MSEKLNRLAIVLKEKDIRQKDFAQQWGKSLPGLSNICNNKSQPSLKELKIAADLLGVSLRELVVDTKPE